MTDWSLAGLQHWFQKALHNPRAVDGVDAIFEATPGLDAGQGLAIYQRSYYLRLTKCLQDQFPALNYALGADLFFDFAQEYIHAMPSESYTLYRLGERFSQYLNAERPDRDKSAAHREPWIDFMVELADFEWQLFSLFDAAGHEFGDWPNEATDYPDEDLVLQPCFALSKSQFPVGEYYHAVRRKEEPGLPSKRTSRYVSVRRDFLTRTWPISSVQCVLLEVLSAGVDVQRALSMTAAKTGKPLDELISAWRAPDGTRARWLKAGVFVVKGSNRDATVQDAGPGAQHLASGT